MGSRDSGGIAGSGSAADARPRRGIATGRRGPAEAARAAGVAPGRAGAGRSVRGVGPPDDRLEDAGRAAPAARSPPVSPAVPAPGSALGRAGAPAAGRPPGHDPREDRLDPRPLPDRVHPPVGAVLRRQAPLLRRVVTAQPRVGAQGVAEVEVLADLRARLGDHVEMDRVHPAAPLHRAHEDRTGRRPRVRSALALEAEAHEPVGRPRHGLRRRDQHEVDDALPGEPGNGRAAEVLDPRVRQGGPDEVRDGGRHLRRTRVRGMDPEGALDVRTDDETAHRGSVGRARSGPGAKESRRDAVVSDC